MSGGPIMGKSWEMMGNVHEHHVASGEINENTIWENTSENYSG